MNALIFGGTGAMGSHLVSILASRGVNCCVTTRRRQNNRENIEFVVGDAHDIAFIKPLFSKCQWDVIVDFMKYSTKDFEGRVNLLLSKTKQYIFLSSSRVYAESKETLTENSPRLLDVCTDINYLKTDEYALAKARQEDILRNSGYSNWTIIRPYVTFSEQRLQLSALEKEYWLYRAVHGRTIVFPKDLSEKTTTLTYGQDVARGIVSLIGKEKAKGNAYHITISETHKWLEILNTYLDTFEKKTGIRPKVLFTDKWEPFHGGNKLQVTYDRIYDRKFDNNSINEFIDTSTFKPTLPALEKCLTEFLDNPVFKNINWRWEAKKDRLTGEWASFSEINGMKQKIIYVLNRIGVTI
jgi:nucleoside-diphosphate-sugar epimerase